MKFYSRLLMMILGMLFLVGLFLISSAVPSRLLVWVMFFPITIAQFFATEILKLDQERSILLSLGIGIPLTVFYWWFWLRGLRALIRR